MGCQVENHTHRKGNKTHEFIFMASSIACGCVRMAMVTTQSPMMVAILQLMG